MFYPIGLHPENLFASGEPFCVGYLLSPWLRLVRPGGMDPCPQAPNKRPHTQNASLRSMRLDRRTHREHSVRPGVCFFLCWWSNMFLQTHKETNHRKVQERDPNPSSGYSEQMKGLDWPHWCAKTRNKLIVVWAWDQVEGWWKLIGGNQPGEGDSSHIGMVQGGTSAIPWISKTGGVVATVECNQRAEQGRGLKPSSEKSHSAVKPPAMGKGQIRCQLRGQ